MARIPVAQYLRISTEHQTHSLTSQMAVIQAYADSHSFELVQTYKDEGRSGLTLQDRPALMQLLNDIITGEHAFRAVLVYDVSRWGRFQDCDEAAHYEFICRRAEVPIHYCAESFQNDNSMATTIIKALKRGMAAEYSREMGLRSFRGLKKLAECGFKQGGQAGYGLRRLMVSPECQPKKILARNEVKGARTDRVVLVPGPQEEVEIVRETFRLVAEDNKTPYSIAQQLRDRGVQYFTGPRRFARVCAILGNPKYAGVHVWNRTSQRLGSRRVQVPSSEWVVKPQAFQPIISLQLFERVQKTLAQQRQPYPNEEVLMSLRHLRMTKGELTCNLVNNTPGMVSLTTLAAHFGSVRRAFELAGKQYRPTEPTSEQHHNAKQLREKLFLRITSLFPKGVSTIRATPESPACLFLEGDLKLAVIVCPAVCRVTQLDWFVDRGLIEGAPLVLLGRLGIDNSEFLDYYVLPAPKRRWLRCPSRIKHSMKLDELAELRMTARRVAATLANSHCGASMCPEYSPQI